MPISRYKFNTEQLRDKFELAKGESVTGKVIYEVPIFTEKNNYSICHYAPSLNALQTDYIGNRAFFVNFEITAAELAEKSAASSNISPPDDRSANSFAGGIGDMITNGDVSYRVNSATMVKTYDGRTAEESEIRLVIELMVKNESYKPIEIYESDFPVQWDDGDEDYDGPLAYAGGESIVLSPDKSFTRVLAYKTPVFEGTNEYRIRYRDEEQKFLPNYAHFDLTTPGPNDEIVDIDSRLKAQEEAHREEMFDAWQAEVDKLGQPEQEEMGENAKTEPTIEDVMNAYPQTLFEYYNGYLAAINWDDSTKLCNVTPEQQARLSDRIRSGANAQYYFELIQIIIDMDTVEITESDDSYTIQFYAEFQFIPETRTDRIRQEADGNVQLVNMVYYKSDGACLVDNSQIIDGMTIGTNQIILQAE